MTITSIWESLIPIARNILSILSPIVVLVLIIAAMKWVIPTESLNVDRLSANLPSILAIIIVSTICLLPLLGQEVPIVLTNIALVIVGYYFGKLKV